MPKITLLYSQSIYAAAKITPNLAKTATKIFKQNLGNVPSIFSYPFGEYSLYMKNYIAKNFKIAFGQHSGIFDINKDKFE